MEDIEVVRFNALAAYCRQPFALIQGTEVRWLQSNNEDILIVVVQDIADSDFSAILLARDLKERYRWVAMTKFFPTPRQALAAAAPIVKRVHADLENERRQGDEKGRPVDFFTAVVAEDKLNPDFLQVSTAERYSPAAELIKPMMRWYEDADGNFVEQFQTTGFNARLWELYLFAALVEAGHVFNREHPVPDFRTRCAFGELCVEATTVNPTRTQTGELVPPPPRNTEEEIQQYVRQYMPIRYAGPLTTKLAKRYWENKGVGGLPFAIAIQDFHAPASMLASRAALPTYLYGMEVDVAGGDALRFEAKTKKIENHIWGTKKIESGFFSLPDSENISAVVTNASATISKFNRMGLLAGFGSNRGRATRQGTVASQDLSLPDPTTFVHEVNALDYREHWMEGMDVFHNPRAKHPLRLELLNGAVHHWLTDEGKLKSVVPKWHPFESTTRHRVP